MAEDILKNSGRLLLLGDALAMLTAFITGGLAAWATDVLILGNTFQPLFSFDTLQEFLMFAGLGVSAIVWMEMKGHYRQRLPYWEIVGQIITVAFVGFIMGGFIQFAMKNSFSRLWLGFSWSMFAAILFLGRRMVRRLLEKQGKWQIPSLFIGNGATAESAMLALCHETQMGFSILGQIPAKTLKDLEKPMAWTRLMRSHGASHVFLALEGAELEQHQQAIKVLVRERLSYSLVPPWLGLPSSTLTPHHFMMQDAMLLHNTNRLALPLPRFIKRVFDIVVASTALLLLSPLLALVALLVSRDKGPVFFSQDRVGQNGKIFKCHKFRSMRVDAEQALVAHLANDRSAANEWAQFQKLKNDPRITTFGEFIRRTSMDELPQLVNVLWGEMSLVGPRPIMRGQESYYGDDFVYYSCVRPGITGPWQVSGRNKVTFKKRVELEAWYARNWNLWMDIVILLKTVRVLLKKDQAF